MTDIDVTILGSGTCIPSLRRGSASILAQTGNRTIVIDTGPGTMRRLLEAGKTIFEVTHIFYTHFHPDHISELVPFLFASKSAPEDGRKKPLVVGGGPGLIDYYHDLQKAHGDWVTWPKDRLKFLTFDAGGPDRKDISGISVETAPMDHNPESTAYRITGPEGKSVVYSGDTDENDDLVTLSEKTDLLICESAFPDDCKVKGHLTPSRAGTIASRAGVKKLVLTHFYPICDTVDIASECRRTWSGPLILAEDLMMLQV